MNKIKNLPKMLANKLRWLYHLLAFRYCVNKTAKLRVNGEYAEMYYWKRKGKEHMTLYLEAEKK